MIVTERGVSIARFLDLSHNYLTTCYVIACHSYFKEGRNDCAQRVFVKRLRWNCTDCGNLWWVGSLRNSTGNLFCFNESASFSFFLFFSFFFHACCECKQCWLTRVCRDKTFFSASILLSRQKTCLVATNTWLSRQYFCRDKNDTCGSSLQWYVCNCFV